MRNMLALIGAAVVLFVGIGWYQGWYTFAIAPGTNGKQRIEVDVDTKKIAEDARKAAETVSKTVGEPAPGSKAAELVGPPLPPDMPKKVTVNSIPGPLPTPPRN